MAALLGGLGLPALLAIAFAIGALSVFFDVAYQACLVRLVKRDQLLQGNSAIEGSRSAAQIGGPALGGTMTSLLSAPIAAASSALFFVVSFVSIACIRRRESIPVHPGGPQRMWRQIHEGLHFVAGDTLLRTVCLASAAFQFSLAAMMTTYLLFLPGNCTCPALPSDWRSPRRGRARWRVPCSPPVSRAASVTERCSSRRRSSVTA